MSGSHQGSEQTIDGTRGGEKSVFPHGKVQVGGFVEHFGNGAEP